MSKITERECRTCGRPCSTGLHLPQCRECAKVAAIHRELKRKIEEDKTLQRIKGQMSREMKEIRRERRRKRGEEK